MSSSINTRVGVFVRCRPLLPREQLGKRCLTITGDIIHVGDKNFNFESVFGEESTQSVIYDHCVRHLVDGCFQGYNGTIFACKKFVCE